MKLLKIPPTSIRSHRLLSYTVRNCSGIPGAKILCKRREGKKESTDNQSFGTLVRSVSLRQIYLTIHSLPEAQLHDCDTHQAEMNSWVNNLNTAANKSEIKVDLN